MLSQNCCFVDYFEYIVQRSKQKCSNVTRPPQTTYGPTGPSWHMKTSGDNVLLINSVFYDDRPKGGRLPTLRILAIADFTSDTSLYCYLWYAGVQNPVLANATLLRSSYIRQNPEGLHEYLPSTGFLVEYIILCRVPTNQFTPSYVSVVAKECVPSNILVPVTFPQKPEHTVDFGICVAPSFGKIHTEVMVEWFELHKILGVQEFNIYNVSMDDSIVPVLQYYISSGDLILHNISPIIPTTDDLTAYMNSLPVLNHCLFTNMYRYEHVVIVDFDEFITPKGKQTKTYTELISVINQKYDFPKTWTSLTFHNEFFFYDYPLDSNQPYYLPVLQRRLRYNTSTISQYPKSMLNPRNCMTAGNHNCMSAFPDTKDNIIIAAEIATNHHYRRCDFPPVYINGTCVYLKSAIPDDTMLKYKVTLDEKVKGVLEKLGSY